LTRKGFRCGPKGTGRKYRHRFQVIHSENRKKYVLFVQRVEEVRKPTGAERKKTGRGKYKGNDHVFSGRWGFSRGKREGVWGGADLDRFNFRPCLKIRTICESGKIASKWRMGFAVHLLRAQRGGNLPARKGYIPIVSTISTLAISAIGWSGRRAGGGNNCPRFQVGPYTVPLQGVKGQTLH